MHKSTCRCNVCATEDYPNGMIDAIAEIGSNIAFAEEHGRIDGPWACKVCGMRHKTMENAEACCTEDRSYALECHPNTEYLVADKEALSRQIRAAWKAAGNRPALSAMLGIRPDTISTMYWANYKNYTKRMDRSTFFKLWRAFGCVAGVIHVDDYKGEARCHQ